MTQTKRRIYDTGMVPKGGVWKWQCPHCKAWVQHPVADWFEVHAVKHWKAHGLPVGLGFKNEVWDQVAANQPEMTVEQSLGFTPKRNIGMTDVMNGLKVMASFKLAGSPLVSQEEANRRAAICAKCKLNTVFKRPCGGLCNSMKQAVLALIGSAKTPYDNELKSCSICACYTSAHVWVPMEHLRKGLNEEMIAQFKTAKEQWGCWKSD